MLDSILKLTLHSPYEAALRIGLLMIAVALFTMLVVRLAMSLVSISRAKARKQWQVEPPIDKEESLLARLVRGDVDESKQQVLFTDEVRALLAGGGKPATQQPTH